MEVRQLGLTKIQRPPCSTRNPNERHGRCWYKVLICYLVYDNWKGVGLDSDSDSECHKEVTSTWCGETVHEPYLMLDQMFSGASAVTRWPRPKCWSPAAPPHGTHWHTRLDRCDSSLSDKCAVDNCAALVFGASVTATVAGSIEQRSQHVWRCQMCRLCLFNSVTTTGIDAVPVAGPTTMGVRRQWPALCCQWWAKPLYGFPLVFFARFQANLFVQKFSAADGISSQ